MHITEFSHSIYKICSKETCYPLISEKWCKDNRFWIFKQEYHYIANALQLSNMRHNLGRSYRLDNNIDLSVYENWIPIPTYSGSFNGEGFTISGMTITIPATSFSSEMNYGLFSTISGKVHNLTVTDFYIYSPVMHNGSFINVGVIAGINNGSIYDCKVYSDISLNGYGKKLNIDIAIYSKYN